MGTPGIQGPSGSGQQPINSVDNQQSGKMQGHEVTVKQSDDKSGDKNIFQRLGGGLINIITWPGRKIAATIRGLIGRFTHKKTEEKTSTDNKIEEAAQPGRFHLNFVDNIV
ncbi:MAG: hypothetical protein ACQEP8_02370 [Chlamydiota bacterium]